MSERSSPTPSVGGFSPISPATTQRLQHLMSLRENAEAMTYPSGAQARDWLGEWQPAADWLDLGSHLLLLLDIPAAEPESLELREDGDELTVAGVRAAWPQAAGVPLSRERFSGAFSRTLRFPEPVLEGTGEAELSAGVLRVRFAKRFPTIDAGGGVSE